MDGEPVWVEIPEGHVAEWCIAKWDPLMRRTRLWGAAANGLTGGIAGRAFLSTAAGRRMERHDKQGAGRVVVWVLRLR